MFGTTELYYGYKQTRHNSDRSFSCCTPQGKKSQQVKKEVKACALYAGLNKVDADWFNSNDVMVNPNAHWSAHHLHLELPLVGSYGTTDDLR